MRAVVIGAGVVGAAIAARLARLGCPVTLLEASHPGSGTTGTTFGWVNASAKQPRAYFELSVAGMAAHRRARAELGSAPWLRLSGHLRWAGDGPGQAALAAADELLRSWGYPVATLSRAEAQRLEPDLDLGAAGAFSFYPDEGLVHPLVYLGHLLRSAEGGGAQVRGDATVAAFDMTGGRLRAAVLATGERVKATCSWPAAAAARRRWPHWPRSGCRSCRRMRARPWSGCWGGPRPCRRGSGGSSRRRG